MIAVAVLAIIGTAIATTTTQLFVVQAANSNRMDAVKQVENALHYINRDVQQAININTSSLPNFLILSWQEWDEAAREYDAAIHLVTYSVIDGELQRTYNDGEGSETITRIADHISQDAGDTNCSFDSDTRVLTVTITATVEGFRPASETRTLQVKSRPQP